MNPTFLRIRQMAAHDLDFADDLRAAVGWNQTREDWLRFLAAAPEGCFLAEADGVPVGTATTIRYGVDLAWIGMVLVRPEWRRRGVGGALLDRCLESLRAAGVRWIRLDATPLGRPVYARLGFRAEFDLTRWEAAKGLVSATIDTGNLPPGWRRWEAGDGARVAALDQQAFGASRPDFLENLGLVSSAGWVVTRPGGAPEAYGLMRPGARAWYLGPVVASDPRVGLQLVQALLSGSRNAAVFWDLPDFQAEAAQWAESQGFRRQRTLTRMVMDPRGASRVADSATVASPSPAPAPAPEITWQMAISGPETG
ncbi:MAG: GNAT family N-acetyltransferase [Verrucomicrobiales bacterium]|nr:GNAT family N-acetyltransferase [Verrucomicrobiales bacterium]